MKQDGWDVACLVIIGGCVGMVFTLLVAAVGMEWMELKQAMEACVQAEETK